MNYNDDEVRLPDEVIREQLLEDTRSDFEKQMDEAIQLSQQEFREKEQMYTAYEQQILEEYNNETNKRRQLFAKLLFDLNKIGKIDKEVREIYTIVEPIIDAYCLQYITQYDVDIDTHKKIFDLLSKVRTDQSAIKILRLIIVC